MSDRVRSTDSHRAAIKTLIHQARLECSHPNSQPAVCHTMLMPKYVRQLEHDKNVRRVLIAEGLAVFIRDVLKHQANGVPELGITQYQLDLWDQRLRAAVLDVGRPRVYVPSRDEYVLLEPDEISSEEIIEAGDYLKKKARDCDRRAEALYALARQRNNK